MLQRCDKGGQWTPKPEYSQSENSDKYLNCLYLISYSNELPFDKTVQ